MKAKSNPCCSVRSFLSPSAVVMELNRCSVDSDTLSPTSLFIQDHYPKATVLKTSQHKRLFFETISTFWLLVTLRTNCFSLSTTIPGKQREGKMWMFKLQDTEDRSHSEVPCQKKQAQNQFHPQHMAGRPPAH